MATHSRVLQGRPVEPRSKFKLHAESSHIMSARSIRHVYDRTYGPRARCAPQYRTALSDYCDEAGANARHGATWTWRRIACRSWRPPLQTSAHGGRHFLIYMALMRTALFVRSRTCRWGSDLISRGLHLLEVHEGFGEMIADMGHFDKARLGDILS